MENNISAIGDRGTCVCFSGCRICKGVCVKLLDRNIRICINSTCTIAVSEQVHGFICHTDHYADIVSLCHKTGNVSYQIGSLLLAEHQTSNIGQVNGSVINNSKLTLRICFRSLLGSVCQHIAYADDQVVLFINKRLNVWNVVCISRGLKIIYLNAKILCRLLKTLPGRLVEGTVIYTAYVCYKTDLVFGSVFFLTCCLCFSFFFFC